MHARARIHHHVYAPYSIIHTHARYLYCKKADTPTPETGVMSAAEGGAAAPSPPEANSMLLPIPSLHFGGKKDTLVPIAASRALAAMFSAPQFREHPQGHVFPSQTAECDVLLNFIDAHLPPAPTIPPSAGAGARGGAGKGKGKGKRNGNGKGKEKGTGKRNGNGKEQSPHVPASSSNSNSSSAPPPTGPVGPPAGPFTASEDLQEELEALQEIYPDVFVRACLLQVQEYPHLDT